MAVQLKRWRFTVDDYHQMARAGILDEDARVELIEGEIVEMAPIGDWHAGSVIDITHLLVTSFGDVAAVSVQNPVRLDQYNEPQPDFALLHRRTGPARFQLPTPGEIFLLIEVADSSATVDRRIKMPLYARHAIVEVWLVDLRKATITVYRDPSHDGYRTELTIRRGERLSPLSFPDRVLSADDILGEP
jgi:Uma2 family endonuclease